MELMDATSSWWLGLLVVCVVLGLAVHNALMRMSDAKKDLTSARDVQLFKQHEDLKTLLGEGSGPGIKNKSPSRVPSRKELAAANTLLEHGTNAWNLRDLKNARKCLAAAAILNPQNAVVCLRRASVFYEDSELDECIEQCAQALALALKQLAALADDERAAAKVEKEILERTIGKSHEVYAEALHARLKYQSAAEHFTAAAEYINPKENLESASTSRFMENKEKIDSAATKKKSKQHANDLSALLSRGSIATSALIDAAVQDDETASQSSSNGKEDASDSAAEAEIANAHVSNAPADAPVHQEAKAEGSKAKQTTAAGGEGSCNACPAAAALADGCTSLRDADDVQSNANESAASQLEQEHSKFPPALKALEGVVVLLSGLSKECYNGATAKVVGYNETNGRFVMLLVDTEHANRKIQVKPSNITPKPRANTVSIPGNFQDLAFDPENDILLTHIVAPGPNGDLKGFQEQVQEAVNASSKLAYDLNNIVSKDKIGSGADFSESLSETLKANNLDPGRVGQLFDKLQGMLGDKADDMGTDDLGTDNRLEIEEISEHEPLTLDGPNGSAGEKIDEVADEDDALTTHVDRQSVNRAISSEVPSTISQFDVGDHIRLHGLGKAYYNGLEGSVIEVKRQAGRIGVRISSTKTAGELDETAKVEVFGKELSVKPENLEKLMPRVITPNYKPDAAEQLVQSNIIKGVEPAPLSADTAQKTPRIKTPFGYLEAVVGPSGAAALAASGGGGMNGDVTLQDLDGSLRIDDIARGNSNAVADTEPSFEDLLQSFKDEDEARKNKKSGSKGALEEGAPVATSPDGPAKRKKKKKKKKKSAAASAAADGGSSMLADGQNDKAVPVASTAATSPKTGTLTGIRQREIRAKRETMDAKEDDHSLTLQDVADYEVFVQGMIDAMEGEKQQLQRKYRMAEAKLKHTRDSRRIRVLGEEIDNLKRREQRFNGDVAYVNEEVERFHNSPAFKMARSHVLDNFVEQNGAWVSKRELVEQNVVSKKDLEEDVVSLDSLLTEMKAGDKA